MQLIQLFAERFQHYIIIPLYSCKIQSHFYGRGRCEYSRIHNGVHTIFPDFKIRDLVSLKWQIDMSTQLKIIIRLASEHFSLQSQWKKLRWNNKWHHLQTASLQTFRLKDSFDSIAAQHLCRRKKQYINLNKKHNANFIFHAVKNAHI